VAGQYAVLVYSGRKAHKASTGTITGNHEEAGRQIAELVSVSRDDMAADKTFVMRSTATTSDEVVREWINQCELSEIKGKTISLNSFSEDDLRTCAREISQRLAIFEAIVDLCSSGVLFCDDRPHSFHQLLNTQTAAIAGVDFDGRIHSRLSSRANSSRLAILENFPSLRRRPVPF
jgi:hypothetical protein